MDNCKTGSFSRMATECQSCPDKDTCNKKRMEALAYIIPSTPTLNENTQSFRISFLPEISIQPPGIEDMIKRASEEAFKNINRCAFGELRR